MADFNEPQEDSTSYVTVLENIRANFDVVSTMSYGGSLNVPTNAVQFLDGAFSRWNGVSFDVVPVSISGGGTGAGTAAGARAALNVNEKGTAGGQVRTNAQSDALYVPQSRTVSTAGALNGGGALNGNLSLSIDDATTSQKGAVQLYDGVNSTSTTLALTANQGKILKDYIDSNITYTNSYMIPASGDMTSGTATVVRVGDVVTITGGFNHASASLASVILNESWAHPKAGVATCIYSFDGGARFKQVSYSSGAGLITFNYRDFSSSLSPDNGTGTFTLSYVGVEL